MTIFSVMASNVYIKCGHATDQMNDGFDPQLYIMHYCITVQFYLILID